MNYSEQDQVEYEIEQALNYLQHEDSKSQFKIDKNKKIIARNINWLKENAPDSIFLAEGAVSY